MTQPGELSCPKCGGRAVRDLSAMRRGTGWGLLVLGVLVLGVLALMPARAPTWGLVACGIVALLGVVALLGAGQAKYCPTCQVRLRSPSPDDPPPPPD